MAIMKTKIRNISSWVWFSVGLLLLILTLYCMVPALLADKPHEAPIALVVWFIAQCFVAICLMLVGLAKLIFRALKEQSEALNSKADRKFFLTNQPVSKNSN